MNVDINKMIEQLKDEIAMESTTKSEAYLPNIIEFCESKRYLNLTGQGITLFPVQKIILKAFYRGQAGNEHLALTDEELKLLFELKLTNVIEKYHSKNIFRQLVLVLGRRSGKDFLTSLMALYEAMKLIECPGGSPFTYYEMASGNPIYILTIATSSDQARILFTEIKERMQASVYFRNKIGKMESDRMWFLTPEDRKKNKELIKAGFSSASSTINGSICIMSGHSNSEGLLGKRIFTLLLDEVASFKSTGSVNSGERIYSSLTPATADFKTPGKIKFNSINEEHPEGLPMYDSKIISISSPRAEEGILFRLYKESAGDDSCMAIKLPTWKVNAKFREDSLRNEFKFMSPVEFQMEFGAEFSGTAGEKFIPDRYVDEAMEIGAKLNLDQAVQGRPGLIYYAHLDPAATSHNYALVVLHVEERVRMVEQENGLKVKNKFKMFVVDHMKMWSPTQTASINVEEVDRYIISLAQRFRMAMVSYDVWSAVHSTQKLRAKGIPCKVTPFRKAYKNQIYNQLEDLMVNHQLALPQRGPYAEQMMMELKCLKRIYAPTGFKIQPDPEAQTRTDDMCVHPETIVFTSNGPQKIQDVSIGDSILTHRGRYHKILKTSKHKLQGSMFKLKPYYGLPLYATGNHPIEVLQDGERSWKRLDELTISDKVIRSFDEGKSLLSSIDMSYFMNTPRSKHHQVNSTKTVKGIEYIRMSNPNAKWHKKNVKFDYDFGYLCGIYAAEGSIGDHCISIAANIGHNHIHNKISLYCERIFGFVPTKPILGDGQGCQIQINSQLCKGLFLYLFGKRKAPDKIIPSNIMTANEKCQNGFISGFFEGDGSSNNTSFTFTSTSVKMIHQLQQLLLSFRIVSSISISKRSGETTKISGRIVNYNSDLYNLRVIDATSFNLLSSKLGYELTKIQSKFHKPKYEFMDSAMAVEIRSITRSDDIDEVVNISVDKDHSYVANSVNTHNCDALAGAIGVTVESAYTGYPKAGTVLLPQSRSLGQQDWKVGTGVYPGNLWNNMQRKFGKPGGHSNI